MKPPLVIFGNSPFISTVDVPSIIGRHKTAACNQFGYDYAVDALFSFDDCVEAHHKAKTLYLPDWSTKEHGEKIVIKSGQKAPFPTMAKQDGKPVYAFQLYTVSLALQWAVWQKPSAIYLVGVDHVETDTVFQHYHGAVGESQLSPKSHKLLKAYAAACGRIVPVYQTNPAVARDWPIPFKPLDELYGPA